MSLLSPDNPPKHASSSWHLSSSRMTHHMAYSGGSTKVTVLASDCGDSVKDEPETVHLPQPTNDVYIPPSVNSSPIGPKDKELPLLPTAPHLRYGIFTENAPKPAMRSSTPTSPQARIESTLQLVFCARLLAEDCFSSTLESSAAKVYDLDDAGREWLNAVREDPSALARIHWLVSRLVAEFVKDTTLRSSAISEVVLLGPVLCQVDYRALLSNFVERFDLAALHNEALLQGMIQLLQSAPTRFIADDDLIRIVEVIRKRLESTHVPSKDHVYQLVVALTKVLEVMVGREVKGLSRQRFHQPLVAALRSLQGVHDDEFLKFQINYAYQTSLSLPDDETSFQAFLRYAKSLAVGISAVASVFKLDPKNAFDAIKHLQQLVRSAFDVVKFNNNGTQAFKATANEATQAAEKAYPSRKIEPWFRILQRAHGFIREGRLVDFNQLICDTACLFELDFRRGISLILGELAIDPLWDIQNRRRAIDFLGDIFRDDFKQGQKGKIASWITSILSQISVMDLPNIFVLACSLLHDLGQEQPIDAQHFHPLLTLLPLSTSFPLLDKALDIPYVEYALDSLRLQRLEECLRFHSIPLHAAENSLAPSDKLSPLMGRAEEFLDSERLVFLLLGDSGSGKSTFCKQLERELWIHYKEGDRIPLLVDLSSIEHPENDLIEKHLRQHNFSHVLIQELKYQRRFVLICDGYDEPRLTKNLHTTNRFNRKGQWDIKMFITCRNTFLGQDYQGRFHPQGADRYHDVDFELFEEATVAPFSQSDIRKFVEQSIHSPDERTFSNDQTASSVSECMQKLSTIPNMIGLVTNPFLLTLALKALLFLPIDAFEPSVIITTRLQLYDRFVRSWIQLGKKRLERTPLNQETFTVFEHLLQDNFTECAIDFLKRLAEAIFEHQSGLPIVEYSHRKDKGSWKARFFGDQIEPTLLREASPLTRAGIRHWFIHTSLLEYFYSLTFYDPNDGGTGQPPGGGGGSSYGSSYGSTDGGRGSSSSNGGSADANGDSTGGNGSSGGSDGTTGGDSGYPSGNNNHSSGSGDSPGDNPGNPSDGRDSRFIKSGSGGNEDGSGDDDEDDSDDDEDDSDEDEDDSDDDGEDDSYDDGDFSDRGTCGLSGSRDGAYQRKNNSPRSNDIPHLDEDILRRSDKGPVADTQPSTSTDPFSRKNLFNEPAVLQFLVERAQLDERLKERLESTIMQSKSSKIPSLAAANALLILLRAGERFSDVELEGVLIPGDYLAKSNVHSYLLATLNTSTTGMGLLKAVSICFNLHIVQTFPIKPQSKRSLLKRPVFSGEQTGAMATHNVKLKPLTKDQRSREYGQRSIHSRAPRVKRFFQLDSHESLGDLESEKSSSDLDSDESFSDLEWYASDVSSGNTRTPLHRHNLSSNSHKDHNSTLSKDNWEKVTVLPLTIMSIVFAQFLQEVGLSMISFYSLLPCVTIFAASILMLFIKNTSFGQSKESYILPIFRCTEYIFFRLPVLVGITHLLFELDDSNYPIFLTFGIVTIGLYSIVTPRLFQKFGRKDTGVERSMKNRQENIEAELPKWKLRQILTWILAKILDSARAIAMASVIGGLKLCRLGVSQDYAEAMTWYRKAAEQGDATAQNNIGSLYRQGLGVPQDYVEAMAWYQKAAEQEHAAAQINIGSLYDQGLGVSQDYVEAMTWYRKAAEQGDATAQNNIGSLYRQGLGVSQDYVEAMTWFWKAAEQGHAAAQINIGYLYDQGLGVSQDYAEAMTWYRKAAEQEHAAAQINIGSLYDQGLGVSQDYAEAMTWYRKAAEQGNATAQNNIGSLYDQGLGVSQDYAEAMTWYRKAAEQEHAAAQINIGSLYRQGLGVSQDYVEAMTWYQKAAEQGHATAQNNIGYLYYQGLGVSQDYAKAMTWFLKAAEQGHATSQYYIGLMFEKGLGVTKDKSKALGWYKKAA